MTPIRHTGDISSLSSLDKKGLTDFGLKFALGEKTSSPNTIFTTPGSYANIAMGFPELEFSASEIYHWPRPELPTVGGPGTKSTPQPSKNRCHHQKAKIQYVPVFNNHMSIYMIYCLNMDLN